MPGWSGGTEATGGALAEEGAAADAEGVTSGAEPLGAALGTSTLGVVGTSGFGSQAARAMAARDATERSVTPGAMRAAPQKMHADSVDFTWRLQRGQGTKAAIR